MGADVRSIWVAGRMSLSPMPRKLLSRLGWPGSAFRSEKLVAVSSSASDESRPRRCSGNEDVAIAPQHLVLERATSGYEQRAQRLLGQSRNPALDELAKETLHHLGRRQPQGTQFGPGPSGCIPHVWLPRPANPKMRQDFGPMAPSRATMPVIGEICDRRPNLLGQICNGRVRKLAGSPTKAAGRAVEHQLCRTPSVRQGRVWHWPAWNSEAPCLQSQASSARLGSRPRPKRLPSTSPARTVRQIIRSAMATVKRAPVATRFCNLAVFQPIR